VIPRAAPAAVAANDDASEAPSEIVSVGRCLVTTIKLALVCDARLWSARCDENDCTGPLRQHEDRPVV
jgi:hypothetical protein